MTDINSTVAEQILAGREHPDDLTTDELSRFVVEAGNFTNAAGYFGWLRDKFTRYLSRRGVKAEIDRALEVSREAAAEARQIAERVEREGREREREKAREERERTRAPDLTEEVTSEETLQDRVKEMEAQQRALRKEQVRDERVRQMLVDAIPRREAMYEPLALPDSASVTPHEMVLLFSDLHAGETVDREETMGLNEYRWEIMLERMAKLQKSVLSYQAHRPYPITRLTIAMLGDMLSGDIHDELSITNEMPLPEAVVQLGYDVSAWIEEFVPHFEHIHVVGVPGNHPRATRKPQAKNAHNNADWTMYQFVQLATAGPDPGSRPYITWDFPRAAYAVTTVAERWRMLLMHGDGIRTTMPGVPWGGVVRRITTLEQQFAASKQPIDYFALGHFHTRNALEGVSSQTFINGSLKGLDEYSLKSFGSGRPPGQLLLTFHPRNGWTDLSNIDLEGVSPNGAPFDEEVAR